MPKALVQPDHVAAARLLLKSARTAEELRRAQAVVLPIDLKLTLAETANAIGRTIASVVTLRKEFIKERVGPIAQTSRRRSAEPSAIEKERLMLMDVLQSTSSTGELTVTRIKPFLEAKLGTTMVSSTVYRMLARHGWRKNAPFPNSLLIDQLGPDSDAKDPN